MTKQEWCPGLKDDAHDDALQIAWKAFQDKEPQVMARNAGGIYSEGTIKISTFGRECVVDPGLRSISIEGKELKPLASLLVLHYLLGADGTDSVGRAISYRQLPGGNVFFAAFKKRVMDEIEVAFHHQPQLLLSATKYLGATKLELGDASITIHVFPKLPVTVIIWRGDQEVEGKANILFDETAPKFMSTEDLAGVGSFVVTQLIKAKMKVERELHNINEI